MKLEECKKCKSHVQFQYGEVLCNYWGVLDSRTTTEKSGEKVLVGCPRETEQQ